MPSLLFSYYIAENLLGASSINRFRMVGEMMGRKELFTREEAYQKSLRILRGKS